MGPLSDKQSTAGQDLKPLPEGRIPDPELTNSRRFS